MPNASGAMLQEEIEPTLATVNRLITQSENPAASAALEHVRDVLTHIYNQTLEHANPEYQRDCCVVFAEEQHFRKTYNRNKSKAEYQRRQRQSARSAGGPLAAEAPEAPQDGLFTYPVQAQAPQAPQAAGSTTHAPPGFVPPKDKEDLAPAAPKAPFGVVLRTDVALRTSVPDLATLNLTGTIAPGEDVL